MENLTLQELDVIIDVPVFTATTHNQNSKVPILHSNCSTVLPSPKMSGAKKNFSISEISSLLTDALDKEA